MADIKPLSSIAQKWTTVTPQRAPDYEAGIKAPRRSWAQAASDANDSYVQGVTEAASAGRFADGVNKAGDSAWRDGALNKGVARWPQGVRVSGGKYQQGFAPFHSVIQSTTLTPRGPKGDPRNYDRVSQIGTALHDAKASGR